MKYCCATNFDDSFRQYLTDKSITRQPDITSTSLQIRIDISVRGNLKCINTTDARSETRMPTFSHPIDYLTILRSMTCVNVSGIWSYSINHWLKTCPGKFNSLISSTCVYVFHGVYKKWMYKALQQFHSSTGAPPAVSPQPSPAPTNTRNEMKLLKMTYYSPFYKM